MVKPSQALRCWRFIKSIGDPRLDGRGAVCIINSIMQYLETYGAQHQGWEGRRFVNSVGVLRLVVDLVRLARGGVLASGFECLGNVVAKFGIGDLNLNDPGFSRFMRSIHMVLKALSGIKVDGEPIIIYTPCDESCKLPGVVSLTKKGVGFRCPEVSVETVQGSGVGGKVITDIDGVVRRLVEKCGPTYIGFEWAVKKTLSYIGERGKVKIDDIVIDLREDYMWIVRYLYWQYSEYSIPKLVRCVLEELAREGLIKLDGDLVSIVK